MGIQGIIRPPPEIRAVADKTATFVAKNGRDFETRILNSAKGKTPKFAFLHASSPFHAYYEDRIAFYTNGGATREKEGEKKEEGEGQQKEKKDDIDKSKAEPQNGDDGKGEEGAESKEGSQKQQTGADQKKAVDESTKMMRKAKSIVDPVAKALLAQRAKIREMKEQSSSESKTHQEEKGKDVGDNSMDNSHHQKHITPSIPPRQIYTTPIPPKAVSPSQLEIIKVTAQFVALNGGSKNNNVFLRQLTIQEWQNPLYGFLQPRHGHYAYFTQLVDIYRRILQRTVLLHEQSIGEEKKDSVSTSDTSLLTMSYLKKFVGLDSSEQIESTGLQLKEEIQSMQNMAGNVHTCLDYAAYQAEYDRHTSEKQQEELEKMMDKGGDGILGGASRIDWHDFVVVETIDFAVDEVVESLPPPPPPLPKEEVKIKPISVENDDMEGSSDEDDEDKEGIQVVPDYTPKVVSSQAKFASESRTHVIDPITKKSIAIADMSEHMRIQLLDPKWAAEKERFMEKQKDSNLVRGDVIALNVNAFTKARGDLFASSVSISVYSSSRSKF